MRLLFTMDLKSVGPRHNLSLWNNDQKAFELKGNFKALEALGENLDVARERY